MGKDTDMENESKGKIALISLGCAKNLVNSEQMLCLLDDAGFKLTSEFDGADAVIINTCGFIDSAKSEAIDNILEMAELKKQGRLGKIIVTGCMAQRYPDEIRAELPEVDAIVGVGSFADIVSVTEETLRGGAPTELGDRNAPVDEVGRFVTTGPAWAYLKIAEGFDNRCALYLQVLNDLWTVDEGLNSDVTAVSVDLSETSLTESEQAAVAWAFGGEHGISQVLSMDYEQLAAEGYLTGTDPDSDGMPCWENGCLFTVTEQETGDTVTFDAQKWRSALGAYFFCDCTASRDRNGRWGDYTVGSEAIS